MNEDEVVKMISDERKQQIQRAYAAVQTLTALEAFAGTKDDEVATIKLVAYNINGKEVALSVFTRKDSGFAKLQARLLEVLTEHGKELIEFVEATTKSVEAVKPE